VAGSEAAINATYGSEKGLEFGPQQADDIVCSDHACELLVLIHDWERGQIVLVKQLDKVLVAAVHCSKNQWLLSQ